MGRRAVPVGYVYFLRARQKSIYSAVANTLIASNVKVYNCTSQEFLPIVEREWSAVLESVSVWWLDAHGFGFELPLEWELCFIFDRRLNAFVFVDDFKVDGMPDFEYNVAEDGRELALRTFSPLLKGRQVRLFQPCYTEHTSRWHSLRGWLLLVAGELVGCPLPFSDLLGSHILEVFLEEDK